MEPVGRGPSRPEIPAWTDDGVVGETEAGVDTSKALRALTKASRACLLYDFDNEAVAGFLRELDLRMERALEHGPMRLEVLPTELVRNGEVVYRDDDREKSLAHRLFQDGVRSLTVRPQISWHELTRLVGILSVRYSGIRQQEEDIVTLLWKARLEHIELETAESYLALDNELGDDGAAPARSRLRDQRRRELHEYQLPRPRLVDAATVGFSQVAGESIELLLREDSQDNLPALCHQLVERLLASVVDSERSFDHEECLPLLRDIRDFLISDQLDRALLEVVRMVHQAAARLGDPATRDAVVAVFSEREAFVRMLDATIAGQQTPDALIEVVRSAPLEGLGALLQLLASRWTGEGRDLGRRILAGALTDRLRQAGDPILAAPSAVAADALDLAVELDPEFASTLAVSALRRDDRTLRLTALDVLQRTPYRSEVGRALVESGLAAADREVCGRAAAVLAARGERRAFPAVARVLEEWIENGARPSELEPLADAIAALDPQRTVELAARWVRPGGVLQRVRVTPGPRWEVAVRALAAVPGDDAAELLRWIQARSEGELKRRCSQAVARQQELRPRD